MNIEQAKQAGAKAYVAGKKVAPCLNPDFICAACVSETPTAKLLAAYTNGWTIAHLANDAPLATMPSVAEFNRLMA